MAVLLPRHISFCSVGGRLIFLDIRGDRYFTLGEANASLFEAAVSKVSIEPDARRRLIAAGVVAGHDETGSTAECAAVEIPASSLLDAALPGPAPSVALLIEVGILLLAVRRELRRGRLGPLVERTRAARLRSGQTMKSSSPVAIGLIKQFQTMRRFAPTEPNCLLDTLVLARFLARRRCHPTMVFGVKLDPFAAHCWLQDARQILNDTPENAAAFTPILVI